MVPERRTSVRASRIANGDTAPSRVTGTANSAKAATNDPTTTPAESVSTPRSAASRTSRRPLRRRLPGVARVRSSIALRLLWGGQGHSTRASQGRSVSRGRGPTSLAPLFRQVADRLDVVAVRIVRVGAVVMLVVLRPEPRLAVVLAARGQRRRVERVDGGAVWARERDVRRP